MRVRRAQARLCGRDFGLAQAYPYKAHKGRGDLSLAIHA